MIPIEAFFNENIINIFTDASVKKHDNGDTESVAGNVVCVAEKILFQNYIRLLPSTNNEGEIYAIRMAIEKCIDLRHSKPNAVFNIFSDSKISVFGLREWYKGWIKNANQIYSNKLISSSGEEVKNQEIFIECFNMILASGIHINLYHVRGHMDLSRQSQYDKFAKDFKESNGLSDYPSKELIEYLVKVNSIVDNTSRNLLSPNDGSIPTITTRQHKLKSEYLFTQDMSHISKNKRKYASLIDANKKF